MDSRIKGMSRVGELRGYAACNSVGRQAGSSCCSRVLSSVAGTVNAGQGRARARARTQAQESKRLVELSRTRRPGWAFTVCHFALGQVRVGRSLGALRPLEQSAVMCVLSYLRTTSTRTLRCTPKKEMCDQSRRGIIHHHHNLRCTNPKLDSAAVLIE